MQLILSDHNCEGQAKAIFDVLTYQGVWLELVPADLGYRERRAERLAEIVFGLEHYLGSGRLYLP